MSCKVSASKSEVKKELPTSDLVCPDPRREGGTHDLWDLIIIASEWKLIHAAVLIHPLSGSSPRLNTCFLFRDHQGKRLWSRLQWPHTQSLSHKVKISTVGKSAKGVSGIWIYAYQM